MKMKLMAVLGLAGVLGLSVVPKAHADDSRTQDHKFLEDSGKGSLAEIKMAQLALQNSTNADVRAFATKMIHDHKMLIHEMAPFAAKDKIPPPAKLERAEQDEYDRLAKKKGESFDKDYIQTMIDDHHKDLADFTTEINSTQNPALKETVQKGAEVIKGHTEMIDGIAHKYGLPAPNTPSGV